MRTDDALHQQVAPVAAVHARFSAARHPDGQTIVDPCRDGDPEGLSLLVVAGAVAAGALLLDDFAGAAAVRAGLHILHGAEHGPGHLDDLALTLTGRAGLRARARLGSASVAHGAGLLEVDRDLLLAAEHCFLKGQAHRRADIGAFLRFVRGSRASPPAGEEIAEDPSAVPEQVAEDIAEVRGIAVEAAPSAASGSVKGCVSELVVLPSLLRIAEDRIGFAGFLEFCFRLLVPRIRVRMVLFGQSPVCFFQRCFVRILRDAQHLVIIPFLFCHRGPFFRLSRTSFLYHFRSRRAASNGPPGPWIIVIFVIQTFFFLSVRLP